MNETELATATRGRPRSTDLDPLEKPSKTVKAWAAGVVEGRGSLATTTVGLRFSIQMTGIDGQEVLNRFKRYFGGSIAEVKFGNDYRQWRWTIYGTRILEMANALKPFLSTGRYNELSDKNEEKENE